MVDTGGSGFGTLLAVYSVDTSTIELRKEISNNDDVLGTPLSAVNVRFDSKHVYYFVVDGKQGATGNVVLNWRAVVAGKPSVTVKERIDTGIFPSIACTSKSNAPDVCDKDIDAQGNFVLKVKGHNFTPDSRVLIKGVSVTNMKGTAR